MNNPGDTQVQGDDEREGSRRLSLEGNQPPAEISGYTMIRRLGTGAYGTVWLAREDNTGRISLRNLRRVVRELGENLTDDELQAMKQAMKKEG